MKKIAIVLLPLMLLCACSRTGEITTTETSPTTQATSKPQFSYIKGPLQFASHDELVKYQSDEEGEHLSDYYYQPKNMIDGTEFDEIAVRPHVYLALYYKLESELSKQFEEQSYEYEQSSSLIYDLDLHADANGVLQRTFIDKGYEPVEYDGITYYYSPEYRFEAKGDSIEFTDELIGHGIAYVTDEGDLMYIHLPAIAPLEEMIKYAEVERVYIK